eukprot:2450486-Pleurochrysis_carterae.AAC.1
MPAKISGGETGIVWVDDACMQGVCCAVETRKLASLRSARKAAVVAVLHLVSREVHQTDTLLNCIWRLFCLQREDALAPDTVLAYQRSAGSCLRRRANCW